MQGRLTLTGGDWNAHHQPCIAHPAAVVVPAAGFFEPVHVILAGSLDELDSLRQGVALVSIHHEDESITRRSAGPLEAIRVLARTAPADFELAPGEAHLNVPLEVVLHLMVQL